MRARAAIAAVSSVTLALCLETGAAGSDEPSRGEIASSDRVWRSAEEEEPTPEASTTSDAVVLLDVGRLLRVLADTKQGDGPAELTLPLPNGTYERFRIEPVADGLHPSPALERYRGKGIDVPSREVRIEWSSRGLHAVIRGAGETVFVDPVPGGSGRQTAYLADDAGRPLLDAQDLPLATVRDVEALMAEKTRRTAAQRKISSRLLDALRIERGEGAAPGVDLEPPVLETGEAGQVGVPEPTLNVPGERELVTDPPAEVGRGPDRPPEGAQRGKRVLVDIRTDVTEAVLVRIGELGGEIVTSVPRYGSVRALLPLVAVEALAELDAVRRIDPASPAATNGEPVLTQVRNAVRATAEKVNTSEGNTAHKVPAARSEHGVDGTGVGIGVISNGIRTLDARQATGDLPTVVTVLPDQRGSGDEGTAMLEIVHDLAPGAHLYYATGLGGKAQFAANIEALCAAGADVIVDDLFYFTEAVFQDGIVAQGVNNATASGCFHFSAAGNAGNLNDGTAGVWEGDFVPAESTELPEAVDAAGVAHAFAEGEITNRVEQTGLSYLLKWADPLGASSNDYDLYALDDALTRVVARSADIQSGTQDPIEWIPSLPAGSRLMVVRESGEGRFLRLNTLRGRLEYATEGQTFGHSAAANGLGVAAVDARSAGGEAGVFDGTESVETFSSDGPRRIFYEPDGTPITPDDFSATGGRLLAKPDISAADNVSTSTPGFWQFQGTSAAAPHAAAIAALMVEAAGGRNRTDLDGIRSGLVEAALDIEQPGPDRDAGAGIPLAPAAVAALASEEQHNAPSGELADRTFAVDDAAVSIDLAKVFDDADGDPLDYLIIVSREGIGSFVLEETVLNIDPLAPGAVTLTVRATDPGGLSVVSTVTVVVERDYGETDYDTDGDGLIEIAYLEQLDAMRYDLNGDGVMEVPADWTEYFAAFADAARNMGCPDDCRGYELSRDMDFDDAASYASGAVDRGWSRGEAGQGWAPVGSPPDRFRAIFEGAYQGVFDGNGHTIFHLYVNRPEHDGVGLFGGLAVEEVAGIGLVDVDIVGRNNVGSLAGLVIPQIIRVPLTSTTISHVFATGRVQGVDHVGGLFGTNTASIGFSRAGVAVTGVRWVGGLVGDMATSWGTPILGSFATGVVKGEQNVGGLVGSNWGMVVASYATGAVLGEYAVGGLVGVAGARSILGSYATGFVSGDRLTGGLVGDRFQRVVLRSNYWDRDTTAQQVGIGIDDRDGNGLIDGGETASPGAGGRSTLELQAGAAVPGLGEKWHARWRGLLPVDAYWDFGDDNQYPVLNAHPSIDGTDTWREFGYQVREGPDLSVTAEDGRAMLTWTGVVVHHWSPAPEVSYTVYRDGEALRSEHADTAFSDTPSANGKRYHSYQVAAVVAGGEVSRSAVVAIGNRPPHPPLVADQAARTGLAFRYEFTAVDDPDDDAVAYSVRGVPDWLGFSATGRTFRGTPGDGDVGTATITVIAADDGTPSLKSEASFELTVNHAQTTNHSPEAVGTLEPLTVAVGKRVTQDMAPAFRDPDADALGFVARSSSGMVARAWIDGTSLVVAGVAAGEATVTVTASDGDLSASRRIGTTVVNAPPVVLASLADRTLPVPGEPDTVYLAPFFRDPDGDALHYTAGSSDEEVATTEVADATLSVVPRSPGETTVTVLATDTEGSNSTATLELTVSVRRDYDPDADGLVDIESVEQLNAVRFDLDGNGRLDTVLATSAPSAPAVATYESAFPDAIAHMGCDGLNGCLGYELRAHIDLDTNRSGMADEGDLFWNDGKGWTPFGRDDRSLTRRFFYTAIFEGNGYSIANLFVDWPGQPRVGLFGQLGWNEPTGTIRNLRLEDVDVTGGCRVGGLVGENFGTIERSHVRGTVAGSILEDSACGRPQFDESKIGGLAGNNAWGRLEASSAQGSVSGWSFVGGLTGDNRGTLSVVRNAYANSDVSAEYFAGGLTGRNRGAVQSSFATGTVEGTGEVGGLVGINASGAEVDATYAASDVLGRVAGGLVGRNTGVIRQSYASGRVRGSQRAGGLVGDNTFMDVGTLEGAVWNRTTSGREVGVGSDDRDGDGVADSQPTSGATGLTSTELQGSDGETDIVSTWKAASEADQEAGEEPWDFGTDSQYPVLRADINGDGDATWQEFGYQLREGPMLNARILDGEAELDWSNVVTNHWQPPPEVTYRVVRDGKPVVSGISGLDYRDPAPSVDYQLAAVVAGVAAARSGIVVVVNHCYAGSTLTAGDRCRIFPTSLALEIREDGTACVEEDHCAEERLDIDIRRDAINIQLVAVRDGDDWTIAESSPTRNRPPEVVGRLEPLDLIAEHDPERVDLASLFMDPDGDELSYSATSSHPPTVAVAVDGGTLAIGPIAEGTATIAATAHDPGGLMAEFSVEVAVTEECLGCRWLRGWRLAVTAKAAEKARENDLPVD